MVVPVNAPFRRVILGEPSWRRPISSSGYGPKALLSSKFTQRHLGVTARFCRGQGRVPPCPPRSVADLAGELQAEHAIDEQERLELRARRDVLTGFHAA